VIALTTFKQAQKRMQVEVAETLRHFSWI